MKTLFLCVTALMLSGCLKATSSTETSRAICDEWRDTLFLPSRSDTEETALGLTQQNATHQAVCIDGLGIISGE